MARTPMAASSSSPTPPSLILDGKTHRIRQSDEGTGCGERDTAGGSDHPGDDRGIVTGFHANRDIRSRETTMDRREFLKQVALWTAGASRGPRRCFESNRPSKPPPRLLPVHRSHRGKTTRHS
ncbi:MAG: hypothetical protein MZV63_30755 [Marinilabiliales bacterium]|nr:hypothetical protein [Marinilabiliales bacterium]